MITNYIAKFKTKPNVAFKSHINLVLVSIEVTIL